MRLEPWFFLLLAAGCSGSGGSDVAPQGASFETEFEALNRLPVTDLTSLPTSGRVSYAGDVQLLLPIAEETAAYSGDLRMSFDFDQPADFVSGRISRLRHDGVVLSGALVLSDGALDRSAEPGRDYQFTADLVGTLHHDCVAYDADGEIHGDFRGADAGSVTGVAAGTLRSDAEGLVLFDGRFVAEAE